MSEEEIFEALNDLKLERIEERSMRGNIITGWRIKAKPNGCEINPGEVCTFIKVKGLLEDTEEALNSAESFVRSIFIRNPETLKRMIEKNNKEN